jgi:simple sugar transport system ATP-binding protein
VVLARELWRRPNAVVAVNPTRGLDVAAQRGVHDRLTELRDAGAALLIVSTDLDEVTFLMDRVGVLFRGRLLGPFGRDEINRERLGLLMAGLGETGSGEAAPVAVSGR